MAKTTQKITVDLFDMRSLNRMMTEYGKWYQNIQRKLNKFATFVGREGVEIVKSEIVKVDAIFTGEMLNSVRLDERSVGCVAIVVDSEHAAFVEFGTGQIGQEHPYAHFPDVELPQEWLYNVGEHIVQATKSFKYLGTEINESDYYWIYSKRGRLYVCKGMPSRPFMFDSSQILRKKISKIIREVFK